MDNFFTSIALFKELLPPRLYACGTVHVNRVGLPSTLKNTHAFKNMEQRKTLWRMHNSKRASSLHSSSERCCV